MINTFCTWCLATWLFGEMLVWHHALKWEIWAQFDLLQPVPLPPNLKGKDIFKSHEGNRKLNMQFSFLKNWTLIEKYIS